MSRVRRSPDGPRVEVADDAVPTKTMVLTGIVRTSKGYATVVAEMAPDGAVVSLKIGPSQAEKRFEARRHKDVMVKAAMSA